MSNTVTFNLCCNVQGDDSLFPVMVDETMTIADLKNNIKSEKPYLLKEIDASSLTLWKVRYLA
jgi:hypothetical protein